MPNYLQFEEKILVSFQCVGPMIPMTKKRNNMEYSTLTLFNKIAPGSVPKPIFGDEEMSYCEYATFLDRKRTQ